MLQAERITVTMEVLVPAGTSTVVDGMSAARLVEAVADAGGRISPVSVVDVRSMEGDEAAIGIAQTGADLIPFMLSA